MARRRDDDYEDDDYDDRPARRSRDYEDDDYDDRPARRRRGGSPPPNYLVHSIFATLCCCLPGGIVAIVFASQVNKKWEEGDSAGARKSSEQAKMWCIISVVAGIIVGIINGIVQFTLIQQQQGR